MSDYTYLRWIRNVHLCREIRECLKLDPDHKSCHDHYKKVKKLSQLLKAVGDLIGEQRWTDCISKLAQVRKVESHEPRFVQRVNGHLCHCHAQVYNPCFMLWRILQEAHPSLGQPTVLPDSMQCFFIFGVSGPLFWENR